MISKYSKFKNDLLLERINESVIYYSPKLITILTNSDNKISKDLLSVMGEDVKPDVTLVDIDDEAGFLSFVTVRNATKNLKDIGSSIGDAIFATDGSNIFYGNSNAISTSLWENPKSLQAIEKSRNKVKIGKLINKIFPGKYTDKEIEEFVNSLKSKFESKSEFELVDGDQIAHWYKKENYKEEKGTLGNSCMRGRSENVFKIYSENKDVCRLLILKDAFDKTKIIGRALVWKIASISSRAKDIENVEYYMDRYYTNEDSDLAKFRNYAEENGWVYKAFNNHHSPSTIKYKGEDVNVGMTVKISEYKNNSFDYNSYPYMDTFKRYDVYEGVLYNDDTRDGNEGQYILENTDGSYECVEESTTVWSEYFNQEYEEDDCVYSDVYNDWLPEDRAINIRGRGWYAADDDDICWLERSDVYRHRDDCIYSEEYDTYIEEDESISVVYKIDEEGDVNEDGYYIDRYDDNIYVSFDKLKDELWYKKLSNKYGNWKSHDGILKELLIKSSYDSWIPKKYAITVYMTKEDSSLYLTQLDAGLLGYSLKRDNNTYEYIDRSVIDKWQYHYEFNNIIHSDIEEKLVKALNKKIEEYSDFYKKWKLNNKGEGSDLKRFIDDGDNKSKRELYESMMERLYELDEEVYK